MACIICKLISICKGFVFLAESDFIDAVVALWQAMREEEETDFIRCKVLGSPCISFVIPIFVFLGTFIVPLKIHDDARQRNCTVITSRDFLAVFIHCAVFTVSRYITYLMHFDRGIGHRVVHNAPQRVAETIVNFIAIVIQRIGRISRIIKTLNALIFSQKDVGLLRPDQIQITVETELCPLRLIRCFIYKDQIGTIVFCIEAIALRRASLPDLNRNTVHVPAGMIRILKCCIDNAGNIDRKTCGCPFFFISYQIIVGVCRRVRGGRFRQNELIGTARCESISIAAVQS